MSTVKNTKQKNFYFLANRDDFNIPLHFCLIPDFAQTLMRCLNEFSLGWLLDDYWVSFEGRL